jgi:hypothetical protein
MNLLARSLLFKANASKDFLASVTCSVNAGRAGGLSGQAVLPAGQEIKKTKKSMKGASL